MPILPTRSFLLARLLAGEVAALALLVRLGSEPGMSVPFDRLGSWLRSAPPDDVLLAGLRHVSLAVVAAILVLTLSGAVARATGSLRAVRCVDLVTPRLLRRALDRAAVLSLAAVLAPTAVSLPSVVRDGRAVESLPAVTAAAPPAAPAPASAPDAPPPVAAVVPLSSAPAVAAVTPLPAARHTVGVGEHLWSIAAHRLAEVRGVDLAALTPFDVAPYWRIVCDHNRARLASGDPNLVYPGEELELPPFS